MKIDTLAEIDPGQNDNAIAQQIADYVLADNALVDLDCVSLSCTMALLARVFCRTTGRTRTCSASLRMTATQLRIG